jgi:hypothetical protein
MPTRMIVSTTSLAFDAVRSCAGRREGALGRCRRRVSPSRWPAGGEFRQGSRSRRCRRERHTELTHLFRGVAPVAGEQLTNNPRPPNRWAAARQNRRTGVMY